MTFLRKFLEWGLNGNVWIWFHMLFGGIGARLFMEYMDSLSAFLLVVILTIAWEGFEFLFDGGKVGMIKIYGSLERWFYDSLGDVSGAILMAWIVIY